MQKSASTASIAIRLNNLEQKFDDFEVPEPEEPDRTLIDRIFQMTVNGSQTESTPSGDWTKNLLFFETSGTTLVVSLYGLYHWNASIYESCRITPFYEQVFGGYRDFGVAVPYPGKKSLAQAIFGYSSSTETAFADLFANGTNKSFAEKVYGSTAAAEWSVSPSRPSLFENIFGDLETVDTRISDIKTLGFTSHQSDVVSLIQFLKDEIKALKDLNIGRELNDLKLRVSRLESKVTW